MGRSEEKTGFFGGKYTEHYDDDGRKTGVSEEKTGFFGGKYTEHRDVDDRKIGESEERERLFSDKVDDIHHDNDGRYTGKSVSKETLLFRDPYTEHRDSNGDRVGTSTEKENVLGDRYTDHSGDGAGSRGTWRAGRHPGPEAGRGDRSDGGEAGITHHALSRGTATGNGLGRMTGAVSRTRESIRRRVPSPDTASPGEIIGFAVMLCFFGVFAGYWVWLIHLLVTNGLAEASLTKGLFALPGLLALCYVLLHVMVIVFLVVAVVGVIHMIGGMSSP